MPLISSRCVSFIFYERMFLTSYSLPARGGPPKVLSTLSPPRRIKVWYVSIFFYERMFLSSYREPPKVLSTLSPPQRIKVWYVSFIFYERMFLTSYSSPAPGEPPKVLSTLPPWMKVRYVLQICSELGHYADNPFRKNVNEKTWRPRISRTTMMRRRALRRRSDL